MILKKGISFILAALLFASVCESSANACSSQGKAAALAFCIVGCNGKTVCVEKCTKKICH